MTTKMSVNITSPQWSEKYTAAKPLRLSQEAHNWAGQKFKTVSLAKPEALCTEGKSVSQYRLAGGF